MSEFTEWLVEGFPILYWNSRRWSCLWKGLPAMVCMIAGLCALVALRSPNESVLVTSYLAAASTARASEQETTEDLCRRCLLILQPTDSRARYQYAVVLARHENGRAARIMQSLAPWNRTGYAPAHFWLAEQMAKSKTPLSPAEVALLQKRLEFSLVGRDAVPTARLMMVDLAVRTGQWKVAVEHLEEVVPRRPDLLMNLAFAYRMQRNESRAHLTADRAAGFYSGLVRDHPQDDKSRLRWADALVFQRKLPEAIKALQAADGVETDPRYGAAIAQIFLLRMAGSATIPTPDELNAPADALLPANRPLSTLELASRIELLAQALHYAPYHPGVMAAVAQLSTEESPDGEQARSWLKGALASGKVPATVHLILGTAAARQGDLTQAVFHLEQANQRDPKLAEAANNLAYALARTDPPRIEQALQLINAALQARPQDPRIHETRGQILLMVGRDKEAVLDLEYVLEKMPNHIQAHAGLATAYQSIGDQDLADRHQKIAEELKSKLIPARPNR